MACPEKIRLFRYFISWKSGFIRGGQIDFYYAGGKEYIKDKGWDKAIDLRKVHHINNGVDLEEFEYNKRNNHVCDEDLESNDKKIVYVGSIRLAITWDN